MVDKNVRKEFGKIPRMSSKIVKNATFLDFLAKIANRSEKKMSSYKTNLPKGNLANRATSSQHLSISFQIVGIITCPDSSDGRA